jgi:hypothetical protein
MQIFKKAEPQVNEFDQRAADLAQQGKDLAAIGAERKRREAAVQAATAARGSARDAHNKLLNDVDANLDATDDDRAKAKKAHQAARDAEAKAAATLASHIADHGDQGDLAARATRLRQEQHYLEQQCIKTDDREDAAEIVRLGSELAAVLVRREQRLQDALLKFPEAEVFDGRQIEKGAGLADIGFPAGTFQTAPQSGHSGENLAVRNIWQHHVLRSVAERYPDVLIATLGDKGAGIVATVQADIAAKKPRWRARGGTSWDILPR